MLQLRASQLRAAALLACMCASSALEASWTPNGEGPAPYSTKARQAMGMDPAAMAGTLAAAGGGTARLGMYSLAVVYLTNNWNVVIALQRIIMKLLEPFLKAAGAAKAAKECASLEAVQAEAREARAKRLAAKRKAGAE